MLAALLPTICYFIVNRYSASAIQMPKHYFPDSIVEIKKRGRITEDTIWHKVGDFKLVNQLGDSVTWDQLKGKIVIADFFFTHCPNICPMMTFNMKRLQESIHNGQRVGDRANKKIHFISITVDPERDSVQRLKHWGDRFQIDPEKWWLLGGDKKTIYDLAIEDIKLPTIDGKGVDTSFFHSEKIILIDSNRHVRGFYNGLDSVALSRITKDIVLLTMEKDPSKKSFLAGKLQIIAVAVLLAIIAVGLFLFIFQKNQTNAATGLEKK